MFKTFQIEISIMYQVFFSCIIIFSLCEDSEQRAARLEEKTEINSWSNNFPKQPNNPVNIRNNSIRMRLAGNVDVKLAELAPNIVKTPSSGLIDITLTKAPSPLFVEYSNESDDLKQIFGTAHTVCRQLGYSSFKSVEERTAHQNPDQLPHCIAPGKWGCSGHEQNLALCSWGEIKTRRCQHITYVTCGVCEDSFRTTEGIIRSPGYPLVHLHDISCHWDVRLPSIYTTIMLRFHSAATSDCTLDKAYVELIYEIQGNVHFEKYCNFPTNKDVRIPTNEVQIRFFSGIFSPNDSTSITGDQGFRISYAALSTSPFDVWRMIVFAIPIALFVLGVITCCIFHKLYFRTIQKENDFSPMVNVLHLPGEYKQCKTLKEEEAMKGLRLRTPLSSIPSIRPPNPAKLNPAFMPSYEATPLNAMSHLSENTAKIQAKTLLKTNLMNRFGSLSLQEKVYSNRKSSDYEDTIV